VTYTKQIARHDKITIDGVDVSNSFRTFGRPSTDSQEDVSGFSTRVDEFLPGSRNQQFTGEAFYTEELARLVEPLYKNRTAVEITWQPDGLVDATREVYIGHVHDHRVQPGQHARLGVDVPVHRRSELVRHHVSDWT
jgi:hypothetical protein